MIRYQNVILCCPLYLLRGIFGGDRESLREQFVASELFSATLRDFLPRWSNLYRPGSQRHRLYLLRPIALDSVQPKNIMTIVGRKVVLYHRFCSSDQTIRTRHFSIGNAPAFARPITRDDRLLEPAARTSPLSNSGNSTMRDEPLCHHTVFHCCDSLSHLQQLVAISDPPHETLANTRVEGGAESEDEQQRIPATPRREVAVQESGRKLEVTLHQVRKLNMCFSVQPSPAERDVALASDIDISNVIFWLRR